MAVPIFTVVNSGKGIDQLCSERPYTTNWYITATIGDSFCVLVLLIALSDLLYNGELVGNYDKDAKRIKCFVILFCSIFSIRAISNILSINSNLPNAPSFTNVGFEMFWSFNVLIYDIIPIMYLVKTHHDAFKPIQKSSEPTST